MRAAGHARDGPGRPWPWRRRDPVAVRAPGPRRERVARRGDSSRCWKIAPRPAIPVAIPTWRNVVLMPDAMPLRRGVDDADRRSRRSAGWSGRSRRRRRGSRAAARSTPSRRRARASAAARAPTRTRPPPMQPAHRHALGELARRARAHEERQQRHRQEAQARLQRRVAQHVLHVERQVQEHREHRRRQRERGDRRARRTRGLRNSVEVEHRCARARLDDDEGDEQDRGADEAARRSARCPSPRRCRARARRSAANSAAENVTRPGPVDRARVRVARTRATLRSVTTIAAMPIGTLTKKIDCQPTCSVSTPPTSGPTATAAPVVAPQIPSAVPRSRPGTRRRAAPARWRTSPRRRCPAGARARFEQRGLVGEAAQQRRGGEQRRARRRRPRRRPRRSASEPAVSRNAASVSA